MAAFDVKAFVLGAALGGGSIGLAAVEDAKTKIRELAPNVATHRVDIVVNDDGSVIADIHQHGVLTADAIAAGAVRQSWVVEDVACNAVPVLNAVNNQCPVSDTRNIPEAFKPAQ